MPSLKSSFHALLLALEYGRAQRWLLYALLLAALVGVFLDISAALVRPAVHFVLDVLLLGVVTPAVIVLSLMEVMRVRRLASAGQARASEAESLRLSRELHDSIAQYLVYLHLRLDAVLRDVDCMDTTELARELETLRQVSRDAYDEVYQLMSGLRLSPSANLVESVRALAVVTGRRAGCEIGLSVTGDSRALAPCAAHEILQIVREALTNIAKHARARRADVTIEWAPGGLQIAVQDDGLGFDTSRPTKAGHLGLQTMRERASGLGGSLRIESRPGQGTHVQLYAPTAMIEPGACGSVTQDPLCAQMAS